MHIYKNYSDKDRDEVRQQLKIVAEKIAAQKMDVSAGLRELSYLWRFADYKKHSAIRNFLVDFNFAIERFPQAPSNQPYCKESLEAFQKQEHCFIQEHWSEILKITTQIMQLPE
jgi:hypothetical protein